MTDGLTPTDQRPRLEAMARVMLRPIGSPLPLGFLGLGAASIMLTALQEHWLAQTEGHAVAIVILAFTVPLEFLAAVFGFLGRDGSGGTGMALLGASWLATAVLLLLTPAGQRNPALGFLLYFVAAALAVPAVAAAFGKVLASVVFFLAGARFALTGVYEYHGGTGWEHASGWLGLALCVVALYASIAFEVEDMNHGTVLPVLRRASGSRAMGGSLLDEIENVQREAGVREQL
jgi:succinate-acetate transporter protein